MFIKISEDTEKDDQVYWVTLGFKKTPVDQNNGLNVKFVRNKHSVVAAKIFMQQMFTECLLCQGVCTNTGETVVTLDLMDPT